VLATHFESEMPKISRWQIKPVAEIPAEFTQTLQQLTGCAGHYAAQLLWQRGIHHPAEVAGFLSPDAYKPTSPSEFGQEMEWAIARLQQAALADEKVAIWGDFDADGITATAVLWEGLGQIFSQNQQLTYYIPNRLLESHGLAIAGMQALADAGYRLIITCDTGSTNLEEIKCAQGLGLDLIITDHHTLAAERPAVTALINPRSLPVNHPLATLSGVAVAYKLVEALYQRRQLNPPEHLLDLVAIGLIADLVELTGDCRYLAQRGIARLQQNLTTEQPARPGVARLLELCRKSGDRPTDISFGLGPRINAISRIYGDARIGVELLTSRKVERCYQLAEAAELANTRRKALQRDVVRQVRNRLDRIDLSTTQVIVLSDPQWAIGILGLVAAQIAQEYGRPTILLNTQEGEEGNSTQPLARGSARSVNQIDLYQLVKEQEHLLYRFGGHPYAAGLSLPVENVPMFAEAINRQLRQQFDIGTVSSPTQQADLTVTVAELGKELFRELKLLEPYGIGNPTPRLLIRQGWFRQVRNRNIQDWRGRKVRYIKTEFELWDDSVNKGFPGVWWEHYSDEVPEGRCDAIVELDFNTYEKRYETRLITVQPSESAEMAIALPSVNWLLDKRGTGDDSLSDSLPPTKVLYMNHCPSTWNTLKTWFQQAIEEQKTLIMTYCCPSQRPASEIWQSLVGIAKYLSRIGQTVTRTQLTEKLEIGNQTLERGLDSLKSLGFAVETEQETLSITWNPEIEQVDSDTASNPETEQFLAAIREEQFRRQYFCSVPLSTLQLVAHQMMQTQTGQATSS